MTTKATSEKNAEKKLHDQFKTELADMYNAEMQLLKALPKAGKAVMAKEPRVASPLCLKETEGEVRRLVRIFAAFDRKPRARMCEAMEGLLSEGDELAASFKGSPACDAARRGLR